MLTRSGPARGYRPHLLDPPEQELPVGDIAPAHAAKPRLGMHSVCTLLLEDLARPLGQRLDRAAPSAGHERSQDPIDDQVGGDHRGPVGQLALDHAQRTAGVEPVVVALDPQLGQHRIGRARVPELVLGHRGRGHGRLDRRRADRPLAVAASERALVVGQRADQRDHRRGGRLDGRRRRAHERIASRISARGTRIMWIQGCSS